MPYDIRQSSDGLWEVFDVDTGHIVKLAGVRLHRFNLDDATAALETLRSRFIHSSRMWGQGSSRGKE